MRVIKDIKISMHARYYTDEVVLLNRARLRNGKTFIKESWLLRESYDDILIRESVIESLAITVHTIKRGNKIMEWVS